MNICLGVSAYRDIHSLTAKTLYDLKDSIPNLGEMIIHRGALVHINREKIVLEAKTRGYSHVFFVDTDMVFPPIVLQKLIEDNKDIVSATCLLKDGSDRVAAWVKRGEQLEKNNLPTNLFKCYAVGAACMLIKTSIFEKMKRPYFFFGKDTEERGGCGEDIWFCKQARKAGFDIWCDPTVIAGHIGQHIYK